MDSIAEHMTYYYHASHYRTYYYHQHFSSTLIDIGHITSRIASRPLCIVVVSQVSIRIRICRYAAYIHFRITAAPLKRISVRMCVTASPSHCLPCCMLSLRLHSDETRTERNEGDEDASASISHSHPSIMPVCCACVRVCDCWADWHASRIFGLRLERPSKVTFGSSRADELEV